MTNWWTFTADWGAAITAGLGLYGPECSFSIPSDSQTFVAGGGTGSLNLTAGAGCISVATSNASWITITSWNGGNGSRTISYFVAPYTMLGTRSGTIAIADKSFTVNQSNIGPDFSLSFDSNSVTSQAGTKARVTVNISRTGGFNGNVTITPPAPSRGIKATPQDPITTTNNSATFKMRIRGRVAPGPYPLTFVGMDDSGRARTATLTLVVQ